MRGKRLYPSLSFVRDALAQRHPVAASPHSRRHGPGASDGVRSGDGQDQRRGGYWGRRDGAGGSLRLTRWGRLSRASPAYSPCCVRVLYSPQ
jgi:hypothetical protein